MPEDIIELFVDKIHERHGFNIRAMDMSEYPLTMDVFLITSADSTIQARAISDHLERNAKNAGIRLHHKEGYDEGSWILLDFVDLVVHIFLKEKREYYNLEVLWNDAPYKDFEDRIQETGEYFESP